MCLSCIESELCGLFVRGLVSSGRTDSGPGAYQRGLNCSPGHMSILLFLVCKVYIPQEDQARSLITSRSTLISHLHSNVGSIVVEIRLYAMEFPVSSHCTELKHSLCTHSHRKRDSYSNTHDRRRKIDQQGDAVLGCYSKRRQHRLSRNAIAEPSSKSQQDQQGLDVEIDNDAEESSTVIKVSGLNKPGLLSALTKKMQNLGLEVVKVAYCMQHSTVVLY